MRTSCPRNLRGGHDVRLEGRSLAQRIYSLHLQKEVVLLELELNPQLLRHGLVALL